MLNICVFFLKQRTAKEFYRYFNFVPFPKYTQGKFMTTWQLIKMFRE